MPHRQMPLKQAVSPPLTKMDAMLNKAMGAGKVPHLTDLVDVVNEPYIDCLHSLTHGNPVPLNNPFPERALLSRAEAIRSIV
jgi:hypothetical protein